MGCEGALKELLSPELHAEGSTSRVWPSGTAEVGSLGARLDEAVGTP